MVSVSSHTVCCYSTSTRATVCVASNTCHSLLQSTSPASGTCTGHAKHPCTLSGAVQVSEALMLYDSSSGIVFGYHALLPLGAVPAGFLHPSGPWLVSIYSVSGRCALSMRLCNLCVPAGAAVFFVTVGEVGDAQFSVCYGISWCVKFFLCEVQHTMMPTWACLTGLVACV